MFSNYFDAFAFASIAHRKQSRKVNGTPYISHPMAVAFALEKMGASADLVIAGVLHDVLEDTDVSEDDITSRFGFSVSRLVMGVTEDKQIQSWKDRKQDYISRISASEIDVKTLSLADKLHNLHSLHTDLHEYGNDLWAKFSAPKNEQRWYYETLLQVFRSDAHLNGNAIAREMGYLVDVIFNS